MFVVMVASECALVAQAGGLGDVVFGLSRELRRVGRVGDVRLRDGERAGRKRHGRDARRTPGEKIASPA